MTNTPPVKTIRGRDLVVIGVLILLIVLLLVLEMPWRRFPKPLTDFQVAEAWLECIDCQGPYLRRLHESSDKDSIARFLRAALLQGPDSARRTRLDRDLLRTWLSDSGRHARLSPEEVRKRVLRRTTDRERLLGARAAVAMLPNLDRNAFFDRYRRGFEVKWRSRAATALGVIRSDTALAALDSALLVAPTNQGDSIVRGWAERARADTGLDALDQWREVRVEQGPTPRQDSIRGQ